jgi:hypothetical protein
VTFEIKDPLKYQHLLEIQTLQKKLQKFSLKEAKTSPAMNALQEAIYHRFSSPQKVAQALSEHYLPYYRDNIQAYIDHILENPLIHQEKNPAIHQELMAKADVLLEESFQGKHLKIISTVWDALHWSKLPVPKLERVSSAIATHLHNPAIAKQGKEFLLRRNGVYLFSTATIMAATVYLIGKVCMDIVYAVFAPMDHDFDPSKLRRKPSKSDSVAKASQGALSSGSRTFSRPVLQSPARDAMEVAHVFSGNTVPVPYSASINASSTVYPLAVTQQRVS